MSDTVSSCGEQSPAARGAKPLFPGVKPVVKLAVLAGLAVCLQGAASAQTAATATWVGKDTSNPTFWSVADNWSPAVVPNNGGGATYNVVIPMPTASGPPQPYLNIPATINNLTINTNASLLIDLYTLTVAGTSIVNNGGLNLGVNAEKGYGGSLSITNTVILSGSGELQLASEYAYIEGSGTLINQQVIFGYGKIEVTNLENEGQIQGSSSKDTLFLAPSTTTNSGLISTISSGTVEIFRSVQNLGGTISGGSGSVSLFGASITGGTLQGPVYAEFSATLNGVTITGNYQISSTSTTFNRTILQGIVTNNGTITVTGASGAEKAELIVNSDVTLTGTGSVLLAGPNAFLDGTGTLTNQQTISSSGSYGNITVNQLVNLATIASLSSDPAAPLTIQVPGGITNTGGTISAASGYINIVGGTVTGGTLQNGIFTSLTLNGRAKFSGGVTLSGLGTTIATEATIDGTSTPIELQTMFVVPDNGVGTLKGTLNNTGNLQLNAAVAAVVAQIAGTVTLTGNGSVTTSNSPYDFISGLEQNKFAGSKGHKLAPAGSDSLTLNGPSFTGCGTFSGLGLNVEKASSMTNPGGYPLIIDATPFTNSGLLSETSPSGSIQVTGTFSNYNSTTNTLTGGSYNLNGTLQFENANLVTNAANITLSGFGQIVNQNGVNALVNFNNNSSKGVFTLSGGQDFSTDGTFTNAGSLIVSKSSTFSIGGSGTNYEQTAGTTTVDGTFTLPAGGLANVTGGTLEGAGSVSGSVSVGNATGTAAMFIIGDSVKTSAAISIANDYTQLATGVMDVQIGGTTAGTQYSQLSVTGPISLQGTLNIKVINKFKPEAGQTFVILTSPSGVTGTFASVNGTSIGSNEHFAIAYNSDSVVLTVESGPEERTASVQGVEK
jgi:hypothetical protein